MINTFSRSETTNRVLERFRIDILLNRYKNNEKVTEMKLAERYSANRSAIRNAFSILETEGLIIANENGTKQICSMTKTDVNNLYDMRKYIEKTAIQTILKNRDLDSTFLFDALGKLVESLKTNDVRTVLKEDSDFHTTIVGLSNNKTLLQTYISLYGLHNALTQLNMATSPEYVQEFLSDLTNRHSKIVLSLISYSPEAVEIIDEHVESGRLLSLKVIERIINGDIVDDPFFD